MVSTDRRFVKLRINRAMDSAVEPRNSTSRALPLAQFFRRLVRGRRNTGKKFPAI